MPGSDHTGIGSEYKRRQASPRKPVQAPFQEKAGWPAKAENTIGEAC
jgi:hypothetical protein